MRRKIKLISYRKDNTLIIIYGFNVSQTELSRLAYSETEFKKINNMDLLNARRK